MARKRHDPLGKLALLLLLVGMAALVASGAGAAPPTYTITELPSMWDFGIATDLNDTGQVVGRDYNGTYLWDITAGTRTALGSGSARGINNDLHVVGSYNYGYGGQYGAAWEWDPINGRGDLPNLVLGSTNPYAAYDINDVGQIVGGAFDADDLHQATLWSADGGVTALPTPGWYSTAWAINNLGQVVGWSGGKAFIWDEDEEVRLLRELSTLTDAALGVNDFGQVVGVFDPGISGSGLRAFAWDAAGGMVNLGAIAGGWGYSQANDINDDGWIVGVDGPSGTPQTAVLWDPDHNIWDLNSLLSANSGWQLREAAAINDLGWICGSGTHDGEERAFLLTPETSGPTTPELSTWMLLACSGMAGFVLRRRRRA